MPMRHTHADILKSGNVFGDEPTVDIREGVFRFIDWYRDNDDWYDPLVRQSCIGSGRLGGNRCI